MSETIKCAVCGMEIPKKLSYVRRHYLDNGHTYHMTIGEFMDYLKNEGYWEDYKFGPKKRSAEED